MHFKTVNEYIQKAPKEAASRLKTIRAIIRKYAPQAVESISYNIPAYKLGGVFLYFAAFKEHVSIYPYTKSMMLTAAEEKKYRRGRGTLQFAHAEKLPTAFIERIVKRRTKEQMGKMKIKK